MRALDLPIIQEPTSSFPAQRGSRLAPGSCVSFFQPMHMSLLTVLAITLVYCSPKEIHPSQFYGASITHVPKKRVIPWETHNLESITLTHSPI